MSWLILGLVALVLLVLERIWAPHALKSIHYRGSCDHTIAEPGEIVTWSGTVDNSSRLPIPFVRLIQRFPNEAVIQAEEIWINTHCNRSMLQWYVEEKMTLGPRQGRTRQVRLSLNRRGVYRLGYYQLSAGDLLGFREAVKTGDPIEIVIIPERSKNLKTLNAVGGFLGDISVRRFILEDPILTVGFRDYTGREPMKAISWTRTATAGKLQVRQYDHTAEQHVMILLNVEGASEGELEECFRLMRSVCEELEQKKIPYGFRTNGNLPGPVGKLFWMAEGLGSRHMNTIFYGLGRADGTCFYSFRYLTGRTLQHRKSNESYIVVTPPLTDKSAPCIRSLEAAVGNGICVLIAKEEEVAQ